MPPQKKPRRSAGAELTYYHPLFDRLTFVLALIGILVVVHLWIQKDRGFDQGCFGFQSSQAIEQTFNCEAVVSSGAGDVAGVSNVVWGLVFYVAVALMSFEIALIEGKKQLQHKRARALLVAFGLAYTAYLVYYQRFVLGELCALCLTSAGVVSAIAIVQAIDYFRPSFSTRPIMKSKKTLRDGALYGMLALLAVVFVGADILYFRSLPVQAAPATQTEVVAPAPPEPDECRYDAQKPAIKNYMQMVDMQDPVYGKKGSGVTVIEVFEPNCPHCATTAPIMKRVLDKNKATTAFYFKPVKFWDISTMQVGALHSAARSGKLLEMINIIMANQHSGGMSVDELKRYATQIGLDANKVAADINNGVFAGRINQQRDVLIRQFGVNSVPAVLINGRFVDSSSKTEGCLNKLIAEAQK